MTFPNAMDAEVWVDEWQKTLTEHPSIPWDRETMQAWFANAITAGFDDGVKDGIRMAAQYEASHPRIQPAKPTEPAEVTTYSTVVDNVPFITNWRRTAL